MFSQYVPRYACPEGIALRTAGHWGRGWRCLQILHPIQAQWMYVHKPSETILFDIAVRTDYCRSLHIILKQQVFNWFLPYNWDFHLHTLNYSRTRGVPADDWQQKQKIRFQCKWRSQRHANFQMGLSDTHHEISYVHVAAAVNEVLLRGQDPRPWIANRVNALHNTSPVGYNLWIRGSLLRICTNLNYVKIVGMWLFSGHLQVGT